jgi:hypothetical protein
MLSAIVACTIVVMPLLPPQHLHRAGIEGRTEPLVHAHLLDQADAASHSRESALSSRHGDHSLAVSLNADFTASSSITARAPSLGGVATLVLPISTQGPVMAATGALCIHGPPPLVSITRGPPSLA